MLGKCGKCGGSNIDKYKTRMLARRFSAPVLCLVCSKHACGFHRHPVAIAKGKDALYLNGRGLLLYSNMHSISSPISER